MKKYAFASLLVLVGTILLLACTKETTFTQAGGDLPAHHIIIQADGSFSPAVLTVASGATVRFVNNDLKPHNIRSADSVSIVTNLIAPNSFYNLNTSRLTGVYAYKCLLDTAIKGSIVVTQ